MQLTHTIRPSVSLTNGEIRLDEVICPTLDIDPSTHQMGRFVTQIAQTRDLAIRAALIRLGWTPPADDRPTLSDAAAAGEAAGDACLGKAERDGDFDGQAAAAFMLGYLLAHGVSSSELMVHAAKRAGHVPHDDRAFGPVIAGMVRRGEMDYVGPCKRERGNGTSGGRLWRIRSTENKQTVAA